MSILRLEAIEQSSSTMRREEKGYTLGRAGTSGLLVTGNLS